MVYIIGLFLFLTPFVTKLFSNILGFTNIRPLRPIYLFLIILNFTVTIFVSSNLVNFIFYVVWVYLITIILFLGYLLINFFKIKQATSNFVLLPYFFKKNIKKIMHESIPIFISSIFFLLICLFSSSKFGDTGAYINISNNFKNNILSMSLDGNSQPNNSSNLFSTIGQYQYSGIYYIYAAWSINNNVIPYYMFLNPLIYWIILSHSINEIILLLYRDKKWSLYLAIFAQLFCLFLTLFNFSWITAANNSPFEILFILIIYEIINTSKWKTYSTNLYYPLFSLSFFSITAYLFYLPLSIVFVLISIYKKDLKLFVFNCIFFFLTCLLFLTLFKAFWPGFLIIVLAFLISFLTTKFFWLQIQNFIFIIWHKIKIITYKSFNFFKPKKWIHEKIIFIKTKINNTYHVNKISLIPFIFKIVVLTLLFAFAFLLVQYNSNYYKISILRIFLLAITSVGLIFCSKSINENKKWFELFLFIYTLWFVSEIGGTISHLVVWNSSAWRFLYLSGNFWMTFIPYVVLMIVLTKAFMEFNYKNFNIKIKKINFKLNLQKISIYFALFINLLMFIFILVIRSGDFSNLINIYSLNVFENIYTFISSPTLNSSKFYYMESSIVSNYCFKLV